MSISAILGRSDSDSASLQGYRIEKVLSQSGRGSVCRASTPTQEGTVIVKMLTDESPTPQALSRFYLEVEYTRRVPAGGQPRVLRVGILDGAPCMVLRDLGQTTLAQQLQTRRLRLEEALTIAVRLTRALAEIHQLGIVHKDINPDNIVLSADGAEPAIIDFGIATELARELPERRVYHLVGSLPYISPEQTGRTNRLLDQRTDLYSLGVTLFELFAGQRPFAAEDAQALVYMHIAKEPAPPHLIEPAIPPVLSAIVMRLLAKAPEERYQSACGLLADLEQVLALVRTGQPPSDFPLGKKDAAVGLELPPRLYGRDAEIAALGLCFDRARGGQPALALVSGYSGIGKSSVVHALTETLANSRSLFLEGKFDQYQRDVPYATLMQALRGLLIELCAGDSASIARWRERIGPALGDDAALLIDLLPELSIFAAPPKALPISSPAEAQSRFSRALRQLLRQISGDDRPLVIFLDDLQWVDGGTLTLIKDFLCAKELTRLLIIGAYRDNETSPGHPLFIAVEELRRAGAQVEELRLSPLAVEHVGQLLADALHPESAAQLNELASLLQQKTDGNPFFLHQLLRSLEAEGLITRVPGGRSYAWDLERIRAYPIPQGIVGLVLNKLGKLPPTCQRVLPIASLLGNRFELATLSSIAELSEAQLRKELGAAVQEGLLLAGADGYRFQHDRVQQAACALFSNEEQVALHLRIGRLLLERTAPVDLPNRLFEIVAHLLKGVPQMAAVEEQQKLAQLCLEAGQRARGAAAFASAVRLFADGIAVLGAGCFAVRPELSFALHFGLAECAFLTGELDRAEALLLDLLTRTRDELTVAEIYRVRVDLYITKGQMQRAAEVGLQGLRLFGVDLPAHPSREEVQREYEEVRRNLGLRSIDSLIDLPFASEPRIQAAMRILSVFWAAAVFTDANLSDLHLGRMVNLSLVHGNTDSAVMGYAWWGVTLISTFHSFEDGYRFGKLALDLVERHGFRAYRAKALYTLELMSFWSEHIEQAFKYVQSAFIAAVDSGDLPVACYCCNHAVTILLTQGVHLDVVFAESERRRAFAAQARFQDVVDIIVGSQRLIETMRGNTYHGNTFSSQGFDEQAYEATLTSERMACMVFWYWIHKMQARFLGGDLFAAVDAQQRATALLWSSPPAHMQIHDYHCFSALIDAARYAQASEEERAALLQRIRGHEVKLREWAEHCPPNFTGKHAVVVAALERLAGRTTEALQLYERAIVSSREHGFLQNEALACELAADLCRSQGLATMSTAYLRAARRAYLLWGAQGRVAALERAHPELGRAAGGGKDAAGTITRTTATLAESFDALTLVKAAQAISGELVLDRLLCRLLEIVVENAGARRGFLFFLREGVFTLEARAAADGQGCVRVPSQVCQPQDDALPMAMVHTVANTKQAVLLDDATGAGPFRRDPYVQALRPRSVLCAPIVRHGVIRGVIYLDHDRATAAFPGTRLQLVEILAAQAAVSLENAILYDELEQRVDARTRELKETQRDLVDAARRAGMAEIATNVLHNVGNVLSSVNVSLDLAYRRFAELNLLGLSKSAALLQEQGSRLAAFLTADDRGKMLPRYLDTLSKQLETDRRDAMAELTKVQDNLRHVHEIVRIQQSYAGSSQLIERTDLAAVIESAVQISIPATEVPALTVRRRQEPPLEALPEVLVDRHMLHQILVNLLTNARHAVKGLEPERREIQIVVQRIADKSVRIDVIDSGVGIATENLPRIFQHGFTTRKDGHGFGLHGAALATREMGGQLTAASAGLGRGATFSLTLPLGSGERAGRAGSETGAGAAR